MERNSSMEIDSDIKAILDECIVKPTNAKIPGIIDIIVDEYLESEFDIESSQIYKNAVQGLGYLLQSISNLHLNECLAGTCEGGHKELVDFIISQGANDWNRGLAAACRGGYKELVELMILKGATDLNWGLQEACRSVNKDMVFFLILKGANPGPWGLRMGSIRKVDWLTPKNCRMNS